MVKVAINGFGRIGRNVLRAAVESGRNDLDFVAINDLSPTDNLAHLLRYDSVHGRFPEEVVQDGDRIRVGGHDMRVTAQRDIADLDWSGIDIVMECTGVFTTRDAAAKHLDQGAKRVLISAPSKAGKDGKIADATIVYGVNNAALGPQDTVISCASCTTNGLAPVAKVLDDAFGIETGFMTTVHAYTGNQPVLDAPSPKDWNRGRAAAVSMIPTSTGAAKAIGLVLPSLDGKLDGAAIRVPTPNVSVVDLCVTVGKDVDVDAVNAAFETAAGSMGGVLQYLHHPLVSADINHDPHSSSFVPTETKVMGDRFVRVLSWYDNEWGFSNRMLDVAGLMAEHL